MKEKIWIVEDDESIRRLLEVTLTSHGYEYMSFSNASDALAEMEKETPAVVIVDIMLDGMDGIEAVKQMRRIGRLQTTPVIMLTAKDTELDKIIGLDAGADDYMVKPFSVLELCARVRAQLRRADSPQKTPESGEVLKSGELQLNTATREAILQGNPIELTFKEFELLTILMQNKERAVSRTELLNRIWGDGYFGETRTLDIHIGTLRQKLGDAAENRRYIKTVRGIGYRFVGGQGE